MLSRTHTIAAAWAVLLSLGATAQTPSGPTADAWTVTARAVHHADALPLEALDDEDRALEQLDARPGRNIAYVDDELRVGRAAGAWHWSLLARSSALLVTDAGTLDLIRHIGLGTTASVDRHWSTRVRYESFQGAGLEAGHRFAPAPAWQVGVAAQVLTLRHWRRRTLDGQARFDAASGGHAFDLASTQADDRLRFPFQQPADGGGAGLLIGADAGWRDGPWAASLGVRDLGWLRWRRLPQQLGTLSTQTQAVDADGFVVYRPLIEGRNDQQGYTRRLSGWWTARASWRAAHAGEFELSSDWVPGFGALPAVAWRRSLADVDLDVQWRFHERRATVAIGWRGWQLRAGADGFGASQRSRELALGGSWRF